MGCRGVWTAPEKSTWKKKLRGLASRVEVMSDVELAHRRIFGRGAGILLNAGTGSIAYGRNPAGRTERQGGLGFLLGDEGSAFWMGRAYLKHVYAETDDLTWVRSFATHPDAVRRIAGLSTLVLRGARKKKALRKIVTMSRGHLLDLLDALRKKLRWTGPAKVALMGGLFQNKSFRDEFTKRLNPKKFRISKF